jgi:GntR family transcriptional regulator of gluconate operon
LAKYTPITEAPTLSPLSRTSLSEATAELLRERIFAGAFKPGARLVEADIARQLGTSRGPVREALAMLRAEGLVREEPGRGTYVESLGRRDIEEIYEVRAGLESVAARLIIERGDEAALAALDLALDRMRWAAARGDRQEFVDADLALHGELCTLSRNGRLHRTWEAQIGLLRTLIRLEIGTLTETLEPLIDEHVRLVDEIRSGDADRATAACWALFRGTSRLLTRGMPDDEPPGRR